MTEIIISTNDGRELKTITTPINGNNLIEVIIELVDSAEKDAIIRKVKLMGIENEQWLESGWNV